MVTKKKTPKKRAVPVDERKLEQWKRKGESLAKADSRNQWDIADWMREGEDDFQKKRSYHLAASITGMTDATLRQFAYTARHVLTRVNELSFGHHRLVAKYTREQQARFLKHAKDNKESVASFAAFLKTLKQDSEETGSPADVAASKVIKACSSLLRSFQNDDFDTLLEERPSPAARTEVLARLKDVIVELNNKLEELEAEWCVIAKGTGA
jgi:hypothetical protein